MNVAIAAAVGGEVFRPELPKLRIIPDVGQITRRTGIDVCSVGLKNSGPAVIQTHRFPCSERKVLGRQKARADIQCKKKDEERDNDFAKTEFQAPPSFLKLKIQER